MSVKPLAYYADSRTLSALTSIYGDRLESLSASDKFDLIKLLADWQQADTLSQAEDGEEVPFDYYYGSGMQDVSVSEGAIEDIAQLFADKGLGENDALALIAALIEQLRSGVFAT